MHRIKKLDHLLTRLQERIFLPLDTQIDLRFRRATAQDRTTALSESRDGWIKAGPDLIWGEPDGYFWFAGTAEIPASADGQRIYLHIDAQFGSTMGRSDPQCLVRIDGAIAQGADGNHRELLLCEHAAAGTKYEIVIEAGTIEDRRQCGFGCRLMTHNAIAEELYYDLRVPLDVARLLAEDDPRRHFLLNTIDTALKLVDFRPGDTGRFARSLVAAKDVADVIYAAQDFADKPVITVTGHTHIDVAWLWRIRETRQKMARSMSTALALMDQYPDYRFMYNQGLLLDYLSEDYPDLFERLKDKQKTGQFEIEGALWLEPDANITSGESFIRHIQHGVAYHEKTYGVRPRIMWLPDTFGYSAALPQLMKLSGIEVFITHKMSWNDTNRMPFETFHWQGIDGTKVPAYFLTTQPYTSTSIGTTYCPDLKPTHVMGTWRRHGQQELNNELFLVYGHGDGGGGPTREMLENIRRMERGIPGCPAVVHGPMKPFFDRLLQRMSDAPEQFPTWAGELYLEFHRGTLTSVAKNKKNNRLAEQQLRQLEALAVAADLAGRKPYPSEQLHALWRIVMLNQFHDILPGSSIGAVFDDSDRDYATFFAQAAGLQSKLAGAFAGKGTYLAFNVLGRPRHGLVRLESTTAKTLRHADTLMPTQTLQRADGSLEQAAPIRGIPALGGAVITLEDGTAPAPASELVVSTDRLENACLAISFDASGRITSVYDKRCGRETVQKGEIANRLQAYRDLPAQFDAWDIDDSFEDQVWEIDDLASADVVETGPYRAAIRFEWQYESSRLVQIVALEAGSNRLDIDCYVDWHEHNTLVKAAFPINVVTQETTAEIQFGHVTRATHRNTSWDQARFETCMHRWVDLSEPEFGAALLNDCKYGYDAKDSTLRLTLLRSPTYPWAEADQGEHRFRYALLVHQGLMEDGGVPAAAEEFNLPLYLIEGSGSTAGTEADLPSLLSVDGDGVTVETVKKAEEGDAMIVRLWETHGRQCNARLALPAGTARVAEVDLLERSPQPLAWSGSEVPLTFSPFEIRTFKIEN